MRMLEHKRDADELKRAVLNGDLPAIRKHATTLSQAGGSDPGFSGVREWSADLAAATDLPGATHALAMLSSSCGECHRDGGVALPSAPLDSPPSSSPVRIRFDDAVDRMWVGLITASLTEWEEGADAYGRAARCGVVPDPVYASPSPHCNAKHFTAIEVPIAATDEGRAKAFADLVLTCAQCHAQLGIMPVP